MNFGSKKDNWGGPLKTWDKKVFMPKDTKYPQLKLIYGGKHDPLLINGLKVKKKGQYIY